MLLPRSEDSGMARMSVCRPDGVSIVAVHVAGAMIRRPRRRAGAIVAAALGTNHPPASALLCKLSGPFFVFIGAQ